jgi:hypothetical protein
MKDSGDSKNPGENQTSAVSAVFDVLAGLAVPEVPYLPSDPNPSIVLESVVHWRASIHPFTKG